VIERLLGCSATEQTKEELPNANIRANRFSPQTRPVAIEP
jgi:hypothetical protein